MQSPPRLVWLLTLVDIVCLTLVLIALRLEWISEENGDETWKLGLYSSCYIQDGIEEEIGGVSFTSSCSYCADSDKDLFNIHDSIVSMTSLRAAKVFGALTMMSAIISCLLVIGHAFMMAVEWDSFPPSVFFAADAFASSVQFILMLITVLCTAYFFANLDQVRFQDETVKADKLDYGLGQALSWLALVLTFIPIVLSAILFYMAYTGKLDTMWNSYHKHDSVNVVTDHEDENEKAGAAYQIN